VARRLPKEQRAPRRPDPEIEVVDPKWLVAKLSPGFKPLLLLNGRNSCLQDVIVLQRN
jgi:hypothetical protein